MKSDFPNAQEPLAGIVGYAVLEAAVVELQFAPPGVSLYEPKGYKLKKGIWQDLTVIQDKLCVRARFEGDREGLFVVDTGSVRTVGFNPGAVQKFGLLKDRAVKGGAAVGVGGETPIQMGVMDWFEIAGHRFEKPTVTFFQQSFGGVVDYDTLGHIGRRFLMPFRTVLNCPEGKIAFQEK